MKNKHKNIFLFSAQRQGFALFGPEFSLQTCMELTGLHELQAYDLGELGNIVVETFAILDVSSNVSLFAHPWKHCCGNKICFPRSKNVS